MKNFKDFISEKKEVYLGLDGYGFYTSKYSFRDRRGVYSKSISNLNFKIKRYIERVYGKYGFYYGIQDSDINIDGLIINCKYINKMVNNYTVFKKFILENRITSELDFYNLIEQRFDDVYHWNGDFFKRNTLPILINTTRKGNIGEIKALKKFKDTLKERNIQINIIRPTYQEDIKGIDAKFSHNFRMLTIQVKPFDDIKELSDGKFKARSPGSLSLNTNYLILYRGDEAIMLKNPPSNKIEIVGNYFYYNNENIV